MLYNLFLTGFLEQNSIFLAIKLEFSNFNGGFLEKDEEEEMDKRGKDKMGCWNLLLDLPRIVWEKIPSNLCPKLVQMCRILGCIYRKRQHPGHGPVFVGHGPVCRWILTQFVRILMYWSEGNLLVDTGACWLDTAPCRGTILWSCLVFYGTYLLSGGSWLVGTTPKCLRYLNCPY